MKILFIHAGLSSFVQSDLTILSEKYNVREIHVKSRLIHFLQVIMEIKQTDLVYGWFASWHTFFYFLLAKLFRKPSIIISGGYDVANMPEIDYGHMRGGIKKIISRSVLIWASRIVCFSQFSKKETITNAGINPDKIDMVYLGLTDSIYNKACHKSDYVITVGNVNANNLKRKGMENFTLASRMLPDMNFILVGKWSDNSVDHLKSIASENMHFTNEILDNELFSLLSKAKVYVQVSAHEGFGLSVAEAMLHECVPVVTKTGSLPEVVGDAGFYVISNNPENIAAEILKASQFSSEYGKKARQRIIDNFSMDTRKRKIYAIIDNLFSHYC